MTGDEGDGDSAEQSSTLGLAVVAELSHRGLLGRYFDYAGYNELKSLSTVHEVQSFFNAKGFASVLVKDDPVWIVDGLEEDEADKQPPEIMQHEFSVLAYPLWLLTRLRKKRRVFPVKKKNKNRYLPTSRRRPGG